jgi:hypothetical protein
MNLADTLGMGSTREVTRVDDGYIVKVTPPAWLHCGDGASVKLNILQFARYNEWRNTGGNIAELLPELSADDLGILIDGIDPKLRDEMFGEE